MSVSVTRQRGVERQPLIKARQCLKQLLPVYLRVCRKAHVDSAIHLCGAVDAQLAAHRLEIRNRHKVRHAKRLVAEAIDQLLLHVVALCCGRDRRNALVDLQPLLVAGDISIRQIRIDMYIHAGFDIAIELGGFALRLQHGFLQQLAVQVIADVGEMSALLGSEQVARAAQLQIAHGNAEARSQTP